MMKWLTKLVGCQQAWTPAVGSPSVRELAPDEAHALFDEQAQRYLGMSGEAFVRKWEANEFEDPEHPDVMRVAMLLPLVSQGAIL